MKSVSQIEIDALSKAYAINAELNELLGNSSDVGDHENQSWDHLIECNGISEVDSTVAFKPLDHVVYSLAGVTGGLLDLTKNYTKAMTNDSIAESFEKKCKDYVKKNY